MNKVYFFCDKDGKITGFSSQGHSGYAEAGEDIVCAGISALTINTVNSLEQLTDAVVDVNSDEGSGTINCRVSGYGGEKVQVLLQSLSIGLQGIQERYGKSFIQVFFEEV